MDYFNRTPWLKTLAYSAIFIVVALVAVCAKTDKWQPIPVIAFLLNILVFGRLLQATAKLRKLQKLQTINPLSAIVIFVGGLSGAYIWTAHWHVVGVTEFVILLTVVSHIGFWVRKQKSPFLRGLLTWLLQVSGLAIMNEILGTPQRWIYSIGFASTYAFMSAFVEPTKEATVTGPEDASMLGATAKF